MEMLTVKGRAGKVELVFEKDITLKKASEVLKKLKPEEKFFSKAGVRVCYSGTDFSYNDEMKLEKAVKDVFGSDTVFVKKHRLSVKQIKYSLSENETICRVIKKSLRSGDEIISDGDLIVYGDVNPGASIIANGNITVIGALRGTACVRKKGMVYATYMSPVQIRIGRLCSYNKRTENVGPAVAMAENGEIILQCL